MQLDFTRLGAAESYRWLSSTVTPRPIAWVSTVSANGIANLAPFSFFQVICDDPATLMVNVGLHAGDRLKDTVRNVRETGELVIHLVSRAAAEAMNATAATLPHDQSEFELAGIATIAEHAGQAAADRRCRGGLRVRAGRDQAIPGRTSASVPDLRQRAARPYRRCGDGGRAPRRPGKT